jgi:hypothetical protein
MCRTADVKRILENYDISFPMLFQSLIDMRRVIFDIVFTKRNAYVGE